MKNSPLYIKSGMGKAAKGSPIPLWGAVTKLPRAYKALAAWTAGGSAMETLFPSDPNKSTLENIATGAYEWSGAKDVVDAAKWVSNLPPPTKEEKLAKQKRDAENVYNAGKPKY